MRPHASAWGMRPPSETGATWRRPRDAARPPRPRRRAPHGPGTARLASRRARRGGRLGRHRRSAPHRGRRATDEDRGSRGPGRRRREPDRGAGDALRRRQHEFHYRLRRRSGEAPPGLSGRRRSRRRSTFVIIAGPPVSEECLFLLALVPLLACADCADRAGSRPLFRCPDCPDRASVPASFGAYAASAARPFCVFGSFV